MVTFFGIAGALAGCFSGIVAALIVGKTYRLNMRLWDPRSKDPFLSGYMSPFEQVALALSVFGLIAGAWCNSALADSGCGAVASFFFVACTLVSVVGLVTMVIAALPAVVNSLDRISSRVVRLLDKSDHQTIEERLSQIEERLAEKHQNQGEASW